MSPKYMKNQEIYQSNFYKYMYSRVWPRLFESQKYLCWFPIVDGVIKAKKNAIKSLNLKRGDSVLVLCIGTGFELDDIMDSIGSDGEVVGVDISEQMLERARKKVEKNNWKNVRLVRADVTSYDPGKEHSQSYDAALCNFGPPDEETVKMMIQSIRAGGRMAISGPQPLKGWRKIFYPITFLPEMLFGLTWEGLQRFTKFKRIMSQELMDVIILENSLGNYFMAASGTKK